MKPPYNKMTAELKERAKRYFSKKGYDKMSKEEKVAQNNRAFKELQALDNTMTARCEDCGKREAEKLCDRMIGVYRWVVSIPNDEVRRGGVTCDREICSECVIHIRGMNLCLRCAREIKAALVCIREL